MVRERSPPKTSKREPWSPRPLSTPEESSIRQHPADFLVRLTNTKPLLTSPESTGPSFPTLTTLELPLPVPTNTLNLSNISDSSAPTSESVIAIEDPDGSRDTLRRLKELELAVKSLETKMKDTEEAGRTRIIKAYEAMTALTAFYENLLTVLRDTIDQFP